MTRWFVIDTRVWEVQAPSEGEALAVVEDSPDLEPACRTTTAEPVSPPAPKPPPGPALRVL